jgi:hypothetical protein
MAAEPMADAGTACGPSTAVAAVFLRTGRPVSDEGGGGGDIKLYFTKTPSEIQYSPCAVVLCLFYSCIGKKRLCPWSQEGVYLKSGSSFKFDLLRLSSGGGRGEREV